MDLVQQNKGEKRAMTFFLVSPHHNFDKVINTRTVLALFGSFRQSTQFTGGYVAWFTLLSVSLCTHQKILYKSDRTMIMSVTVGEIGRMRGRIRVTLFWTPCPPRLRRIRTTTAPRPRRHVSRIPSGFPGRAEPRGSWRDSWGLVHPIKTEEK